MTGHLDRYGDPIEDDDQGVDNRQVFSSGTPLQAGPTNSESCLPGPLKNSAGEIEVLAGPRSTRKARIAEIRAIIRAAKARREAQE